MTIKKTDKGWEYEGVIFTTKEFAEKVRLADQNDDGTKLDLSGEILEVNHQTSFGRFLIPYFERGNTILGLASDLEVTRQSLFKWINGDSMPRPKNCDKIIDILQCSREELACALVTNRDKLAARAVRMPLEDYREVIGG